MSFFKNVLKIQLSGLCCHCSDKLGAFLLISVSAVPFSMLRRHHF